tara:strand:+ start:783 stop:890 length:108 start_codon:yes stop_codon:yes gene_type:complete
MGGLKKFTTNPIKKRRKIKIMNNEKSCYGHSAAVE